MISPVSRAVQRTNHVDWIVASRPHMGESVSGDQCAVVPIPGGVLIVVVDGLGHGQQAADAANAAIDTVKQYSELPVEDIMLQCHSRIRGTRGVAMTIARVSYAKKSIHWCGVGNVECLLLSMSSRAREAAPLRGGIVGYQLPALRSSIVSFVYGDTLLFATDGMRPEFADKLSSIVALEEMAGPLLIQYGKNNDDTLVLAARMNEGTI